MWEIYAYQNSDSLFGIFNASAALMGSTGYQNSLAIVAIVGFFAAFFAYCFQPQLLAGWKWLAMVVLVSAVLVVPRATVGIVDKTGGSAVQVVANVPFGVAVLGSLVSRVGNTLTELFELAFQKLPTSAVLPSEFTYQQHGLAFGNRLIRDTRTVVMQDPAARTDLINFINNCTMYDLIDGTLDPATFTRSDNVWPLMAKPNPARFTPVMTTAGTYTNMTCVEAYRSLDGRMPVQINLIKGRLAVRLNPTLPVGAAVAAIDGQIEQAYVRDELADAAATAADIIRQNAVINAINESTQMTGQRINDPAALLLSLGRSQATAQANASWINAARMAEQALPIFRNTIEALTYAIYPLVILLVLLAPARESLGLLKTYALVLIWIQLWPPLYAVLNYVSAVYSSHELAAAAAVGGGAHAMSIQTAGSIYSTAISSAAAVGGMVTSIPFIAWALVRGLSSFGSSALQSMGVLTGAVQKDSAADATGDVSLGNVTMDQRNVSPTSSSSFVSRTQTANGDWLTSDGTGRVAVQKLANSGYASRTVSARISQQHVEEANRSAEAARSEAIAATTDRSAVLSTVASNASGWSRSSRSADTSSSGSTQEIGRAASHLDDLSRQIASKTGLDQSTAQTLAFKLAASLSGGVGLGTSKGGIGINASAGANADKSYRTTLTQSEQKVLASVSRDDLSEFKRFADRVSRDTSVVLAFGDDDRHGTELASRLATATGRTERADRAYAEKRGMAERISSARDAGEAVSVDLSKSPNHAYLMQRYAEWADRYGEDSAALQILLSNELALNALSPTDTFRDGSAAPTSFEDLHHQYDASHQDERFQPGTVGAAAGRNDQTVSSKAPRHRHVPAVPKSPAEGVRSSVGSDPGHVASTVRRDIDQFDKRNRIVRDQDGTVHTQKSQVKQNIKDLAADVGSLFEGDKGLDSK